MKLKEIKKIDETLVQKFMDGESLVIEKGDLEEYPLTEGEYVLVTGWCPTSSVPCMDCDFDGSNLLKLCDICSCADDSTHFDTHKQGYLSHSFKRKSDD